MLSALDHSKADPKGHYAVQGNIEVPDIIPDIIPDRCPHSTHKNEATGKIIPSVNKGNHLCFSRGYTQPRRSIVPIITKTPSFVLTLALLKSSPDATTTVSFV